MDALNQYEVVIIGGSFAGLSAAMALGRALRKVLVLDSGLPCNRFTPRSHNFLTHDGEKPADILAKAKEQVLAYPTVEWAEATALKAEKRDGGFMVMADNNMGYATQKLLFATGVIDIFPPIQGFAECWGISVLHCPYCHGYEVRGQQTGILLNGDTASQMGHLILNWTDNVTLFTNGESTIKPEDAHRLQQHGVEIIETQVKAFKHDGGQLESVVLEDGQALPLNVLYAHPLREQHSNLPSLLGCETTEHGLIAINNFQQTSVAGVYAAGDNSNLLRSIAAAVASGNMAGAMINKDLVMEGL